MQMRFVPYGFRVGGLWVAWEKEFSEIESSQKGSIRGYGWTDRRTEERTRLFKVHTGRSCNNS